MVYKMMVRLIAAGSKQMSSCVTDQISLYVTISASNDSNTTSFYMPKNQHTRPSYPPN